MSVSLPKQLPSQSESYFKASAPPNTTGLGNGVAFHKILNFLDGSCLGFRNLSIDFEHLSCEFSKNIFIRSSSGDPLRYLKRFRFISYECFSFFWHPANK